MRYINQIWISTSNISKSSTMEVMADSALYLDIYIWGLPFLFFYCQILVHDFTLPFRFSILFTFSRKSIILRKKGYEKYIYR